MEKGKYFLDTTTYNIHHNHNNKSVWKRGPTRVFKKFKKYVLLKIIFFVLNRFDVLILKMIFKK
jgi:hypothetical protein